MKDMSFTEMRDKVEKLKEQQAKAKALYDDRIEKLKKVHGCANLAAARKKLKALKTKLDKAEKEFNERFDNFKKEHGESISAISG